MANDIDKTSPHYKGEFGSIYEVNQKFPSGGVEGDYVAIDGWAHYWNADRGTWCVNAQRDSYWDELITGIINKLKLFKGATYMGVAGVSTVPEKIAGVKMYYFAKAAGTYSGFGGLQLAQGINVLYTDNGTSWSATPLLEVAQELGVSTEKVMSQNAVNTALDKKADKETVNAALDKKADKETVNAALDKKANTADVDTKFTEEKKRVDGELDKKFAKENVVNSVLLTKEKDNSKVPSLKSVCDELDSITKPIHQLILHGGVIEIFPIEKEENGTAFKKNGKWKVRITKDVKFSYGNRYKKVNTYSNNNIQGVISIIRKIPKGEYEFTIDLTSIENKDNQNLGLYYNIKTNTIRFGSYTGGNDFFFIGSSDIYNLQLIGFDYYAGWACTRSIMSYNCKPEQTEPVLFCNPIRKGLLERIDVTEILPDDYSDIDISTWIMRCCSNIPYWYFPKGEYKIKEGLVPVGNTPKNGEYIIEGDGQGKTIFRCWDFDNKTDIAVTYGNFFCGCTYKKCTILNAGFGQYGGTKITDPYSWTMEDVDIHFTLPLKGGYIIYVTAANFTLNLNRVNIKADSYNNSYGVFAGIWVGSKSKVNINDCSVIGCNKPIVMEGTDTSHITNTLVKYGITGIFFGASKQIPLENCVVENCTVEGVDEESISFDTYGNNVAKNTNIAELSISSANIVSLPTYAKNKVLKLYCTARHLTGAHPNEQYEKYPYKFVEQKDYLENMYVYFTEYAGETFNNCIAKILEVGEDNGGEYVIINTTLDPTKLELKPNMDIDNTTSNSNYKVCGIIAGFHNCVIRNCTIRNAKNTPIALYCSSFNCLVDNCKMQNCGSDMYVFAAYMLSKPTYNGSVNNKIVNCTFENVGTEKNHIGLSVSENYALAPSNTLISNNIFINCGFKSYNCKDTMFANNMFVGDNANVIINNKTSTSSIGYIYPSKAIPGQHFFDLNTNKDMIFNGSNWTE